MWNPQWFKHRPQNWPQKWGKPTRTMSLDPIQPLICFTLWLGSIGICTKGLCSAPTTASPLRPSTVSHAEAEAVAGSMACPWRCWKMLEGDDVNSTVGEGTTGTWRLCRLRITSASGSLKKTNSTRWKNPNDGGGANGTWGPAIWGGNWGFLPINPLGLWLASLKSLIFIDWSSGAMNGSQGKSGCKVCIYLSICLSVCLSIYLSIYLSLSLFIYLLKIIYLYLFLYNIYIYIYASRHKKLWTPKKISINLTFATPQVAVCLGIHPNHIPSHRGGRLLPKARHLLQVFFLNAAGWVGPCQKRKG